MLEQDDEVAGTGTRLVLFEKGVVRRVVKAKRFGFAAFEMDDLFEPRLKVLEIGSPECDGPLLLSQRSNAGQLRDERARQTYGALVKTTPLAHVDGLGR